MKKGLLSLVLLFGTVVFALAQQDTTYKSFIGKYSFPPGSAVPSVEVSGDSLKALTMNSEAGISPLEYLGADKFNITNFSGTAEFKRNDTTKQVISVHIEAMGYVLDGVKDSPTTTGWTWTSYYTREKEFAFLKK